MLESDIFKFLDANHVHCITKDETLLVSRQSYYREKYENEGDEWIGDPRDGVSTLHLVSKTLDVATFENTAALRRLGAWVEPGARNVTISNMTTIQTFDEFIFCAAKGEFAGLKAEMCSPSERNKKPYNACLRLKDELQLLETLRGANCYTLDGLEIALPFKYCPFQAIDYTDNAQDPEIYEHNPFVKRERFRPQSEVRMLFKFDCPEDTKTVIVHAPGLAKCFEPVL